MPGIYVEINIQCPMEDLWAKTQTPELHQQWDLRFSDISYLPTTNGIRFLTWYDYTVRFGLLGRCFDAAVFRPLMGWATAWSFDRLRRWLEEGLDPAVALRQSLIYGISRIGVAFTWIYHG